MDVSGVTSTQHRDEMERENIRTGSVVNINELDLQLPRKELTVDKEHFHKDVVGVENDL